MRKTLLTILLYFERFPSVGCLRAIEDLEKYGLPRDMVINVINRLIDEGLLEHREGVLNYGRLMKSGRGQHLPQGSKRRLICHECKREVKAFTYLKGKMICLDCYKNIARKLPALAGSK